MIISCSIIDSNVFKIDAAVIVSMYLYNMQSLSWSPKYKLLKCSEIPIFLRTVYMYFIISFFTSSPTSEEQTCSIEMPLQYSFFKNRGCDFDIVRIFCVPVCLFSWENIAEDLSGMSPALLTPYNKNWGWCSLGISLTFYNSVSRPACIVGKTSLDY